MKANDRQEGGDHYIKHGKTGEQHWDRIIRLYGDASYVYFAAVITKYIERYKDKNGIGDLKKARHYLDKLIEYEEAKTAETVPPMPTLQEQMNEHARSEGLGHWKCTSDGSNGSWARTDGRTVDIDFRTYGNYMNHLRYYDHLFPLTKETK